CPALHFHLRWSRRTTITAMKFFGGSVRLPMNSIARPARSIPYTRTKKRTAFRSIGSDIVPTSLLAAASVAGPRATPNQCDEDSCPVRDLTAGGAWGAQRGEETGARVVRSDAGLRDRRSKWWTSAT